MKEGPKARARCVKVVCTRRRSKVKREHRKKRSRREHHVVCTGRVEASFIVGAARIIREECVARPRGSLLNPSSPPVLYGSLGVLWRVHLGEDALVLLEAKAMHKLSISANGMVSFLVATPR